MSTYVSHRSTGKPDNEDAVLVEGQVHQGYVWMIDFDSFSQRGTGKAYNEDAMLLDGQVHQGRVREHGEVNTSQAR